MDERSGTREAIYGRSGSGKSYLAKRLVRDIRRVVAFDPEGEYGELPGFHTVKSLGALLEALKDCWNGSFKLAYVPTALREEKELHEIACLLEWMQEPFLAGKSDLKVTLLVDELNLSFPISPRPEHSGFARLCSRGRKRGINLIGVTQRPAEVATRFRGNLDRVRVFALAAPQDFTAIKDAMGADGEARVRALGAYEHVLYENGALSVVKPV
ncbi:MAG: DUF87 domain-containing protein [Alphaproteobacteria bacterium]